MKKILTIIFTAISVVLLALYMIFLFIVPSLINFEKIKPQIQTEAKKYGLNIDYKNAKIITLPTLDIGFEASNIKADYEDNKNLLNIDKVYVAVDILSFIFNKVNIEALNVESPSISFYKLQNGEYKINSILKKVEELSKPVEENNEENSKNDEHAQEAQTAPAFQIEVNSSGTKISDYSINYYDLTKENANYSIKGKEFALKNLKLDKNVNFETSGEVLSNSTKLIGYNIKIDSELPKMEPAEETQTTQEMPEIDLSIFEKLKNYNFNTNISADLKIRNIIKDMRIFGDLKVEDLTFKSNNQQLPNSTFKATFKGDTAEIFSEFWTNKTDKISLKGSLTPFAAKNIDMTVITEKTELVSLKNIGISLLDIVGQKTEDIKNIDLSGFITSNFTISSDFKKFNYLGNANIKNVNIGVKGISQGIKDLNINLVSDNGALTLKDSYGLIETTKFDLNGKINSNTNMNFDLKIPAFYINTALAMAKAMPLDSATKTMLNDLKNPSGSLGIEVSAKGNLKKVDADIVLKPNKISIFYKPVNLSLNLPSGDIVVKDNKAEIKNIIFALNKSSIAINGGIDELDKSQKIQITAKGNFSTSDIQSIDPKAFANLKPVANLPLSANISGTPDKISIIFQMFASKGTALPMIELNELKTNGLLLNLEALYAKNSINLSNSGLFTANNFSNDLKSNLTGTKIVDIKGAIQNLDKKAQTLSGVSISTAKPITGVFNAPPKVNFTAKANINVKGTTLSPQISVDGAVSNVEIPALKTKINTIDLTTSGNNLNVQTSTIDMAGSDLIANAVIDLKNLAVINIKNLKVTSNYIDSDKLLLAMAAPELQAPPSKTSPFVVNQGNFSGKKLKSGTMMITDLSCNFDLTKNNVANVKNIKATALGGTHTGTASMNLYNSLMKANISSKGMSGKDISKDILLMPNQLTGTINSNINISLKGQTLEQQMGSLNGKVTFDAHNGVLGNLGKMEYFINAPNLTNLGVNKVIGTLQPKNTGQYDEIKGSLNFKNGTANIENISSKGKNMSLYMQGSYKLVSNYANMTILGRASESVVSALGPVGNVSVQGALGKMNNKFGQFMQLAYSMYSDYQDSKNKYPIGKIPPLSSSEASKNFVVKIDGAVTGPQAVKQFKWLSE